MRPLGERHRELRDRHAHAHEIGRAAGDRRCRGVHDHDRNLGLLGDFAQRHGIRRQLEAGQELDLLAQHQLLGELLGLVGALAGGIAIDELNVVGLAVGSLDGLAVDRLIRLHRLLELGAPGGECTGIRGDQPDLDGVGRGRSGRKRQRSRRGGTHKPLHRFPPWSDRGETSSVGFFLSTYSPSRSGAKARRGGGRVGSIRPMVGRWAEPPTSAQLQTLSATSTINSSLRRSSSIEKCVPKTLVENPHCGQIPSWPSSTNFEASSIRRLSAS